MTTNAETVKSLPIFDVVECERLSGNIYRVKTRSQVHGENTTDVVIVPDSFFDNLEFPAVRDDNVCEEASTP